MSVLLCLTTRPQGCQHCVSKKSGNFAKCLTYTLPQAIGLPRHRRNQLSGGAFLFLSGVTESFCKIQSKFLSFRVLAGGFVMGSAKSLGFQQI